MLMHLCYLKQILWSWFFFKTKVCIFWVWDWRTCLNGKIPSQVLPCFLSFSPHLVCISPCIPGWAETKRIRLIPAYPSTVFFNINGMSDFICSVLCYSRNASFCVSSQGWAPGESRKSRGSLTQHPSPPPPTLPSDPRPNPQQRSLGVGINKAAQIN